MTRHPYSFLGDSKIGGSLRSGRTWHDGLKNYTDGTEEGALQAEACLRHLGSAAGINFRFDQETNWQPIDSQRALLWAQRFGKTEIYMDRLNHLHFENGKSASHRETVLQAASEAGLDTEALTSFLNSNELEKEVWQSYGNTIKKHNIHSIPYFVFSVPDLNAVGGPFRDSQGCKQLPWIVNGSMDVEYFSHVLLDIYQSWRRGSP